MRMLSLFIAVVLVASASASADVMESGYWVVTEDTGGGTFAVTAYDLGVAPNGGISGANIPILGADTLAITAPYSMFDMGRAGGAGPLGFGISDNAGNVVFIGPNSVDAASLLFEVGQAAGAFGNPADGALPWDVPVVLATGTYSAGLPTVDYANGGMNVFAAVGVNAAIPAYIIPEPATMSLLALGGLAALRRRRR